HRPQRLNRPGPVAELVFDGGAEFGEGLVVFADQEQRVVAEAGRAAGGVDDPAAARGLSLVADGAGGVDEAAGADERRASAFGGDVDERAEEAAVVRVVVAVGAGEAGDEDAGGTLKGVDAE